jgi:hypothetical protein
LATKFIRIWVMGGGRCGPGDDHGYYEPWFAREGQVEGRKSGEEKVLYSINELLSL